MLCCANRQVPAPRYLRSVDKTEEAKAIFLQTTITTYDSY
jgi:hypothetical protein